jgi:streptogramin lyase
VLLSILLLAFLPSDSAISHAAGVGKQGDTGEGGPAIKALLNQPFDVAYDADGNLYFSDTGNHKIKKVDKKTKTIHTIAGNGKKGFSGDGGDATKASMDEPYGLAIDLQGTIYFADRLNRRVRKIDGKTGVITTIAGDGSKKFSGDGGDGSKAGLVEPNGVALDGRGNLLIADVSDQRIRSIELATNKISTFAGNGIRKHTGDGGLAKDCSINGARAVKVGPDGSVWILERSGNTLRSIDSKTGIILTRAGTGKSGYTGDDGDAKLATFNGPKELTVDKGGNIYIVDTENHAIRRIDAKTWKISTVAGDGTKGGEHGGCPDFAARLDRPHGVVVAPDGAIVIGDTNNHRVFRVVLP